MRPQRVFAQFKPINHNSTMLQFRNDSGFLSNSSGQGGGLYVIHNQGTQRASDYEQGQLISVGSGVNVRAVAAAHQPSRPVYRRESRSGREQSSSLTSLNPNSHGTTGYRRDQTTCPVTVSVQISRAASISSCDCASSPAARPQIPCIGTTPGRNDSRCAGITK